VLGLAVGLLPLRTAAADPMELVPTASFHGELANDRAGASVAGVGDVNGDGFDDLLIGATQSSESAVSAGQAYLIFGDPAALPLDQLLSAADASFLGESYEDWAGDPVSGAGDVNGDGYADMLVGAPSFGVIPDATGKVYLILGGTGGWSMDTPLSQVDSSFLGEANGDEAGYAVAAAGDVDGDGYGDVLISAARNGQLQADAGKAYVLLGGPGAWGWDTPLQDSDASYLGENAGDEAGYSLDGIGDFDGDGFADVAVGARNNSDNAPAAGKVYVILGRSSGWAPDVGLGQADATYVGESTNDLAGSTVAGAGDVNGDGYDDLLIAAIGNNQSAVDAGKVYLVLGGSGGAVGLNLGYCDASFLGENAGDKAGQRIAGAGDMDGDGYDDLWIGAPYGDGLMVDRGRSYLVLGQPAGWSLDVSLFDSAAWFGGEAIGDYAGSALSAAGDVDGDGYADLLVGSRLNGENGTQAGQAYLFYGIPAVDWDRDADGYTVDLGDCDDTDPSIYPGATELCDQLDNDCDGIVPADETDDLDGDGFLGCEDCDDTNPTVYPGAPDICDAIDNDCDYVVDEDSDADGDGYSVCEGDCDDNDILFRPGAPEQCDGEDNDCDGTLGADEYDNDGDGWIECMDCDDLDPSIYPYAPETCNDYIDSDCMNDLVHTEYDNDNDGYTECAGDCDDVQPSVHPGAEEICDGHDNDCYSGTDESGDMDADGWSLCVGDCDDFNPNVHPAAAEVCDQLDNDCDGLVDNGEDNDLDGYSSLCNADCDDFNPNVNPSMPEIPYNGIDEDCDGADIKDVDGDGHDGGHYGTDCDDVDPDISPSTPEDCGNYLDDDCDGFPDAADTDCQEPPPDDGGCSCDQDGRGGPPWAVAWLGAWVLFRGRQRRHRTR